MEDIELIQDKNLSYDDLNGLDQDAKANLLKTVFRREVKLDDIDITDPGDLVGQDPFSRFEQIKNYTAKTKEDYLDFSDFCFSRRNDFEVEYDSGDEEFETKILKILLKKDLIQTDFMMRSCNPMMLEILKPC